MHLCVNEVIALSKLVAIYCFPEAYLRVAKADVSIACDALTNHTETSN